MCLGSVWNTRFPFDLSASSIAVTMFFISTARAEANCSALIALGAWEVTAGVEELLGAKPGISLFLFLLRLLFCFSALFPAFDEAILVPEAAIQSINIAALFVTLCASIVERDSHLRSRVFVQFAVFPAKWMFTCKFRIFSLLLLVHGFLLLSCLEGNEMSVVVKATAKHTASVSCLFDVKSNVSLQAKI